MAIPGPADLARLAPTLEWEQALREAPREHFIPDAALAGPLGPEPEYWIDRSADPDQWRRAGPRRPPPRPSRLAEVYALSQFFIAYQPAAGLLWRVAERGMVAAQDSGDLHAIGVASWLMGQAHRDAGDWNAADRVTTDTLQLLAPRAGDDGDNALAMHGSLVFESGYTAARAGRMGDAWRHYDQAEAIANRLPASYYHPVTSFSRRIMGAHAVTIAVELRAGGEGVRQSERAPAAAIPSRPRRARHEVEQARAYQLDAQHEAALETLEGAHKAAPETVRYNGYARRIVLEEMDERDHTRRRRASALAHRIGILDG